jgi:hypothetical protein
MLRHRQLEQRVIGDHVPGLAAKPRDRRQKVADWPHGASIRRLTPIGNLPRRHV